MAQRDLPQEVEKTVRGFVEVSFPAQPNESVTSTVFASRTGRQNEGAMGAVVSVSNRLAIFVRQVGQWVIQARPQEHASIQDEATSEAEKARAVSDYESVR
jgi:hypothetical protein